MRRRHGVGIWAWLVMAACGFNVVAGIADHNPFAALGWFVALTNRVSLELEKLEPRL